MIPRAIFHARGPPGLRNNDISRQYRRSSRGIEQSACPDTPPSSLPLIHPPLPIFYSLSTNNLSLPFVGSPSCIYIVLDVVMAIDKLAPTFPYQLLIYSIMEILAQN